MCFHGIVTKTAVYKENHQQYFLEKEINKRPKKLDFNSQAH